MDNNDDLDIYNKELQEKVDSFSYLKDVMDSYPKEGVIWL